MLTRLRAAGLMWPALLTIPALAVLLGLGTWQMNRKAWKDGLQAQIDARIGAAPQLLTAGLATASLKDGLEYLRVKLRGRLLHGLERHLYWPGNGGQGWLVHTPMLLDDGRAVLVNRGWVPDEMKDPAKRRAGQLQGSVEIVGLIRGGEPKGTFTPANEPQRNIWFWRDVPAMLSCSAAEPDCAALESARALTYPFMVDVEREPLPPGGWPRGGTTNLALPNRHLEYVLTWYGLALTLVGVFFAFAISRLRAAGPQLPPAA